MPFFHGTERTSLHQVTGKRTPCQSLVKLQLIADLALVLVLHVLDCVDIVQDEFLPGRSRDTSLALVVNLWGSRYIGTSASSIFAT